MAFKNKDSLAEDKSETGVVPGQGLGSDSLRIAASGGMAVDWSQMSQDEFLGAISSSPKPAELVRLLADEVQDRLWQTNVIIGFLSCEFDQEEFGRKIDDSFSSRERASLRADQKRDVICRHLSGMVSRGLEKLPKHYQERIDDFIAAEEHAESSFGEFRSGRKGTSVSIFHGESRNAEEVSEGEVRYISGFGRYTDKSKVEIAVSDSIEEAERYEQARSRRRQDQALGRAAVHLRNAFIRVRDLDSNLEDDRYVVELKRVLTLDIERFRVMIGKDVVSVEDLSPEIRKILEYYIDSEVVTDKLIPLGALE